MQTTMTTKQISCCYAAGKNVASSDLQSCAALLQIMQVGFRLLLQMLKGELSLVLGQEPVHQIHHVCNAYRNMGFMRPAA